MAIGVCVIVTDRRPELLEHTLGLVARQDVARAPT
jgi:hypothetical protein